MVVVEEKAGSLDSQTIAEPPLIVISARAELRESIEAVLLRVDLQAEALLDDPAAIVSEAVDPSTIVVFACDVERPAAVTALRRLSQQIAESAIIVVSPHATATAVRRTLDAGASALVFESTLGQALTPTIRAVQSGQSVVPRDLRAAVERPYLSYRERQVLTLVCEGMTNAEVAGSLYLAESTIKSHMASIFTKFGVHSRKEAVAVFLDLNLALVGPKPSASGVTEGSPA